MRESLDEVRARHRQETAVILRPVWEAILALDDAAKLAGGSGLPTEHVQRAREDLMRAGAVSASDLPDAMLLDIALCGQTRLWRADMGQVYRNEAVILPDTAEVYVCIQGHMAQALYAPGTEGGRTLFRLLRREPDEGQGYLDYVWGEHVPFGAIRRDPTDGKLYTPIHTEGITLYEPHYPSQVPSQYKLADVDDAGGEVNPPDPPEEPDEPEDSPSRWADLPDNHAFAVGDLFTDYGKTYHVLRAFFKQAHMRPPALLDDFYERVAE